MRPEAVAAPPLGILPKPARIYGRCSLIAFVPCLFVCSIFVIKQQAHSGRRAKRWPNLTPKIWLKIEKILEKGVKIHQKSEEMVPRSVPKAILEVIRFQKMSRGGPVSIFLAIIGATWAILVAIWCPAGRQGGPQNRAFWHQVTKKIDKMRSRTGA